MNLSPRVDLLVLLLMLNLHFRVLSQGYMTSTILVKKMLLAFQNQVMILSQMIKKVKKKSILVVSLTQLDMTSQKKMNSINGKSLKRMKKCQARVKQEYLHAGYVLKK